MEPHGRSICSLSYGQATVSTRKGPRKGKGLSYEVGIELIERTNDDGAYFVVDRNATALASAGKRTLHDDLVALLHWNAADHFQCSGTVAKQELKGGLTLFVGNRLDPVYLTHDDDFFAVVVLRVRDHFGELHELGMRGRAEE